MRRLGRLGRETYLGSLDGLVNDMGYLSVCLRLAEGTYGTPVPVQYLDKQAREYCTNPAHQGKWLHLSGDEHGERLRYPLVGEVGGYLAAVRLNEKTWEALVFFPENGRSQQEEDGEVIPILELRNRFKMPRHA